MSVKIDIMQNPETHETLGEDSPILLSKNIITKISLIWKLILLYSIHGLLVITDLRMSLLGITVL